MNQAPAYGLWALAAINAAVFVLFALSFAKPASTRDWRAFGAWSAFVVALFAEMYGFPLTIYLFSGWLQTRFPEADLLSHDAGHLPELLFGWRANPHFGPFHVLSTILIAAGFYLLYRSWLVLHAAQRDSRLATEGPYAHVRHPQYVGFVLILTGFLLQWPTLLTMAMYPILVVMYVRLARHEEREIEGRFGDVYRTWAAATPAFIPQLRRPQRSIAR